MNNKPNPIELELEKMDAQWEAFVDEDKPVFIWGIPPDAQQLAHTFVKVKEQFENSSDFFVCLSSPFVRKESFALTLAEELNTLMEEGIKAALEDESVEALNDLNWAAPPIQRDQNAFIALMNSAKEILASFAEYFDCLTLVSMPASVESFGEYTDWIDACCSLKENTSLWPEKLKLLFFDFVGQSYSDDLVKRRETFICYQEAPVNLREAMNKVLKEADNGTTEAQLRQMMMDLQYAVGEGKQAEIQEISDKAILMTRKARWTDMISTLYLIRAAGFLNLQLFDKALEDYRFAHEFALQGEQENKPGCDKLRLQAKICEGTTLFSVNKLQEAAQAYRNAAELAFQYQDKFIGLEGLRMESFCYERVKQKEKAWQVADEALAFGHTMDEEQRAHSTLVHVGQAMLRLAENSQHQQYVHKKMTDLLGTQWEQFIKQQTPQQEKEGVAC